MTGPRTQPRRPVETRNNNDMSRVTKYPASVNPDQIPAPHLSRRARADIHRLAIELGQRDADVILMLVADGLLRVRRRWAQREAQVAA